MAASTAPTKRCAAGFPSPTSSTHGPPTGCWPGPPGTSRAEPILDGTARPRRSRPRGTVAPVSMRARAIPTDPWRESLCVSVEHSCSRSCCRSPCSPPAQCGDDDDDTETVAEPEPAAAEPEPEPEPEATEAPEPEPAMTDVSVGLVFDIGGARATSRSTTRRQQESSVPPRNWASPSPKPHPTTTGRTGVSSSSSRPTPMTWSVAVGFLFERVTRPRSGAENPDTVFGVVDSGMLDFSGDAPAPYGDNIAGLVFAEEQGLVPGRCGRGAQDRDRHHRLHRRCGQRRWAHRAVRGRLPGLARGL